MGGIRLFQREVQCPSSMLKAQGCNLWTCFLSLIHFCNQWNEENGRKQFEKVSCGKREYCAIQHQLFQLSAVTDLKPMENRKCSASNLRCLSNKELCPLALGQTKIKCIAIVQIIGSKSVNLGLSHVREGVIDCNLSMSVNTDNKLINGIESVSVF